MSSATPALEIHVHLEDGRIFKFAQSNVEAACKILDFIQPTKFFHQHHFILAEPHAMTAFQCAKVVRLDFLTEIALAWPFHHGATDIQQITEDEFQQRFQPDRNPPPLPGQAIASFGDVDMAFGEIELVNGERIFVQVQINPVAEDTLMSLDQNVFVQQLFTAGGLHARRRGGGVILINPATIVRLAFYPGPVVLPPGIWEASRVEGEGVKG